MKLYNKIRFWFNRHKRIKSPKGFEIQGTPHGKVTRQMKRNAVIRNGDKVTNIIQYIDENSKKLPNMLTSDDEPVDHKGCMRLMYMQYGVDGITMYLNHVRKCYNRTIKGQREKAKKEILCTQQN